MTRSGFDLNVQKNFLGFGRYLLKGTWQILDTYLAILHWQRINWQLYKHWSEK